MAKAYIAVISFVLAAVGVWFTSHPVTVFIGLALGVTSFILTQSVLANMPPEKRGQRILFTLLRALLIAIIFVGLIAIMTAGASEG